MKTALTLLLVCLAASARGQQVHQVEMMRIHYHTEGQHAVDAADSNENGIPDQVEDIMTQTLAARMMFVEVLGFPDPLATERFKTASFLDIHLRHKDVLKTNGVAFDELQRFNKPGDPKGALSICFNVATSVKAPANLTPAHEFFHLIQNGATFFKNRWFTEGTARWSERALGAGGLGPARILSSWPPPEARMAEIAAMAYEASEHFWNPLAARLDKRGLLPETPALEKLRAMRYTDGSPVLKDEELAGWEFIREALLELGRVDDEAFRALGYDRWSEENQRSAKNDAFIFRAVFEVVKRREAR
ncbi:MAG TPA: hypothetical protein DIT64_03465 [Verrucomicrobiales bacterium]|nr:hypothetical protein [Verrucomicrobiales bacterium]